MNRWQPFAIIDLLADDMEEGVVEDCSSCGGGLMLIERIKGGVVCGTPKLYPGGKYHCFIRGKNVDPIGFSTLEEVADFLRANPQGGVRMDPGGGKIVDNIYIDKVLR